MSEEEAKDGGDNGAADDINGERNSDISADFASRQTSPSRSHLRLTSAPRDADADLLKSPSLS